MESKNSISWHQLAVMMFVGLFSPVIRALPNVAAKSAGRAAWLAPCAAVFPLAILIYVMYHFLKNRAEGEGLGHMMLHAMGTTLGKCVAGIYGIWLVIYSGFSLRSSGERLLSTVYDDKSLAFFLILILAVSTIAALGKIRTLARSAEVFLIVFAVVLGLVFLFSLPNVKMEHLLPVTYLDTMPVLRASVAVSNVVSVGVYLLFLAGHVGKGGGRRKIFVVWPLVMLFLIFLLLFTTIGSLGADLTQRTQNPFFVAMRNIRFFHVFERVESVIVTLWTIADFVYVASLILVGAELFGLIFSKISRRVLVGAVAAIGLISAFLIARDGFHFQKLSEEIVPAVNLFLVFVGLPLVFLVGKIRKKC